MHYLDIELEGINEHGKKDKYKLKDFKGKNVILYFYPKDDTPVCTQEALNFKEAVEKLKDNAVVVAVSSDDIDEHVDFHNKHHLNFVMLSDKLNELKEAFKEHLKGASDIHRSTFILDKNGDVIKVWEKVDVDGHIEEITEFFEKENK